MSTCQRVLVPAPGIIGEVNVVRYFWEEAEGAPTAWHVVTCGINFHCFGRAVNFVRGLPAEEEEPEPEPAHRMSEKDMWSEVYASPDYNADYDYSMNN